MTISSQGKKFIFDNIFIKFKKSIEIKIILFYNKYMKKTFVEKLDKKAAFSILEKVFGERFQIYEIEDIKSKKITKLYNEDKKSCWGFFHNQDKYLNIYAYDTASNHNSSICMFDDKIIVLGDEAINNNKHIQLAYKQAMFKQFGGAYKRYLHAELNKELEM